MCLSQFDDDYSMLLTFNIGSSSFVSIYFDVNVAYFVKGTGLVFSQLF